MVGKSGRGEGGANDKDAQAEYSEEHDLSERDMTSAETPEYAGFGQ